MTITPTCWYKQHVGVYKYQGTIMYFECPNLSNNLIRGYSLDVLYAYILFMMAIAFLLLITAIVYES